jgi:hypothetical protein
MTTPLWKGFSPRHKIRYVVGWEGTTYYLTRSKYVSKPKRHPRCYYPLKKLLRKTGMNTMDIYSKGYHYVYITLSRRNIQMIFRAHSDDNHFMVSVPWGEGCFKTLQAKIILMIG